MTEAQRRDFRGCVSRIPRCGSVMAGREWREIPRVSAWQVKQPGMGAGLDGRHARVTGPRVLFCIAVKLAYTGYLIAQLLFPGNAAQAAAGVGKGTGDKIAGATQNRRCYNRSAQTRSNSATLHACAMQPPARWGASPSKTSGICPTPSFSRYRRSANVHSRACSLAAWEYWLIWRYARRNGPRSHGQTVP